MKLHEIAQHEKELTIEEFAALVTQTTQNGRTVASEYEIISGKIHVRGNVHLSDWDGWDGRDGNLTEIPFPFGEVTGNFDCGDIKLLTLKNSPEVVLGDFYCNDTDIKNLEHVSQRVGGFINAQRCDITSLIGIEDQLGSVYELRMDFDKIKEGGLGLMNVKGLTHLAGGILGNLPLPFFYIDRHLKNGGDIFSCQSELIEHGFEAFAEL